MHRKFTYNGATITLHRTRNADELDAELLTSLLMGDGDRTVRDWHRARRYADMLVSVDAVDEPLRALLPPVDAPADALRAGFEAWLNEDGLYRAWKTAYAQVNAPVGDQDTSPAADPKD